MRRASLPVLVLLLSGCLAPGEPSAPPLPALAARVRAVVGELPCEAPVGEGTSANVAVLAEDPLDAFGFVGAGELWLQGGRAYVARYGTGGFSVVDLADPLHPREVGAWDPEAAVRGLDVKTTSDGSAALVGNDDGVRVVDVRDPARMVLEHEERFAKTQAHMLTVFAVAGRDYLAVAKGDGEDLPLFRITGKPGAHRLERVASPALSTGTQLTGAWGPHDLLRAHDAFFLDDPLAGPTLWVANAWDGIAALDVSDPAQPREVVRIPNALPQYTHTVQTAVVEAGGAPRRITASVSEAGVNALRILDTTDLAAPRLLAEWNVGDPAQPQHNLQVVWPWLFVAHYRHGVLAFDLAAIVAGEAPAPVARLASAGESRAERVPATAAQGQLGAYDGTWDVGLRDGLLYATDAGLRVAAFGCVAPGDASLRSAG